MPLGTQLAARFEDDAVAQLDAMVADGRFASRAEALREAVLTYLDVVRRRETGDAVLDGYGQVPETDAELQAAQGNLRRLIAEEPW
jgi:Arc/MetJ-type ribon-helix-helix transcriptional regulator